MGESGSSKSKQSVSTIYEQEAAKDREETKDLVEPEKSIVIAMLVAEGALNCRSSTTMTQEKKDKIAEEPVVYTSPEMVDCDCGTVSNPCKCIVNVILWVKTETYNSLTAAEKKKNTVFIDMGTGNETKKKNGCSHDYKIYVKSREEYKAKVEELKKNVATVGEDCLLGDGKCHRNPDTVCHCMSKEICKGTCARMIEESKCLNGESYCKVGCQEKVSTHLTPSAGTYSEAAEQTVLPDMSVGFLIDPFLNKSLLSPLEKEKKKAKKISDESSTSTKVIERNQCNRTVVTECSIGTYNDLANQGVVGDNLTPHHIPSNKYMRINCGNENTKYYQKSPYNAYTMVEGICINVQGQRHTRTFTYGTLSDKNAKMYYSYHPDAALKFDVINLKDIYVEAGQYKEPIYNTLIELIKQNYTKYPEMFSAEKWKSCYVVGSEAEKIGESEEQNAKNS